MPDVPLTDAATALGVSVETVRRRVKRGQLDARRDDEGRVWITLPDSARQVPVTLPGSDQQADRQRQAPDQQELVDALQSEVSFLRAEIQRRDEQHVQEREQWHERLHEALAALALHRALPAPSSVPDTPASDSQAQKPPNPPRSWWRRWLRG